MNSLHIRAIVGFVLVLIGVAPLFLALGLSVFGVITFPVTLDEKMFWYLTGPTAVLVLMGATVLVAVIDDLEKRKS